MGEANLAYARGETNRAIDVCLEVIKYAPKASEPFQLLSLLYSEMGQNDKALRVGLVSAQLNKDPDEWIELIQQAMMEGDVELVLFCYNNAIQCEPTNIDLHVEKVRFLEDQKDEKRLILAKITLLKYCNIQTNLDIYNKYFNQVMNELDNENDRSKKIDVLKTDMKKFKDKFPVESKLREHFFQCIEAQNLAKDLVERTGHAGQAHDCSEDVQRVNAGYHEPGQVGSQTQQQSGHRSVQSQYC